MLATPLGVHEWEQHVADSWTVRKNIVRRQLQRTKKAQQTNAGARTLGRIFLKSCP